MRVRAQMSPHLVTGGRVTYDVSPDGQQFLINTGGLCGNGPVTCQDGGQSWLGTHLPADASILGDSTIPPNPHT